MTWQDAVRSWGLEPMLPGRVCKSMGWKMARMMGR